MKRQFKISDESNRYSDFFVIREREHSRHGDLWPMVAWTKSRIEAERYIEGTLKGEICKESDNAK